MCGAGCGRVCYGPALPPANSHVLQCGRSAGFRGDSSGRYVMSHSGVWLFIYLLLLILMYYFVYVCMYISRICVSKPKVNCELGEGRGGAKWNASLDLRL